MNFTKSTISLLITFLLISLAGFSQTDQQEPSINSGTLNNQFDFAIKKSSPYLEFRVVKEAWIKKLKAHVADSLQEARILLRQSNEQINRKLHEIDSLNMVLRNTNSKLDSAIKEKNSFRLLGIQISKVLYNLIMWLILAGLAVALFLFIALYKKSYSVINQTKKELETTLEEFEKHRVNARLREEKLANKYHYELKKFKDRDSNF